MSDAKDGKGCVITGVSPMSAYLTPRHILPVGSYFLSRTDCGKFTEKMMKRVNMFPKRLRSSVAYGISKDFVLWFAKTDAPSRADRRAAKRFGNVADIGGLVASGRDPIKRK